MAEAQEAHVKLYWLNKSRAQNILWLLEELNVKYDVELFHRSTTTMLAPPELSKVHPLGKSPVIEITAPGSTDSIKLAESGFITEYLCSHFPEGQRLIPKKWKDGRENQIAGETESWMRYQYLLHYVEGSLMPILVMTLVISALKSPNVPFYVRPITSAAANKVIAMAIFPNAKKHLAMIEQLLETVPEGGSYICGPTLTAADILLSFALIAGEHRFDAMGEWPGGSAKAAHPKVFEYIQRLKEEPGYKRSTDKIRELDGEFEESVVMKK